MLVANGYQTKQIAHELGVKPETVSTHLAAIRKKLGAKTNAHAIAIFLSTSRISIASIR